MPLKNVNADNEGSFSNARHEYSETINSTYTVAEFNKKKYLGNRDASTIVAKRKMKQIGYGSMNPNGISMSFSSVANVNTIQDALRRVRGSGNTVPPKVTHKYVYNIVAPVDKSNILNNNVLIIGDIVVNIVKSNIEKALSVLGYDSENINITTQVISGSYTGSNLTLANYSVVILYTNSGYSTYHANLGSNLNSYVSSGGNLITSEFCWGVGVAAITGFDYTNTPYVYNSNDYSLTDLAKMTKTTTHVITTDISSDINLGSQNINSPIVLQSGSTTIATTLAGNSLIAIKTYGLRRFVGINAYIKTNDISDETSEDYTTYIEFNKLLANYVLWCIKIIS